jgi:DNA-binding Lrp family transcriptional regulator
MTEAMESRFAMMPSDAIDDRELTLSDLRVLGVIGYHSGRKRPAWPKQATIAQRLGLSRETVNRSVRRLWRKGYIDIAHQFNEFGGQRESYYFVRTDPDAEVQPVEVKVRGKTLKLEKRVTQPSHRETSQRSVTDDDVPGVMPERRTPCDLQTSQLQEHPKGTSNKNITPNPKGDVSEAVSTKATSKPKPPVAASVRSEFDQLWKLWPAPGRERSKSRDHCLEQFAKSAQHAPASHIVEAAAAFVRKQDPKFVPGLHRWLSDRKFEHFLPQAAQLPLDPAEPANPAGGARDRNGDPVDWAAVVRRYVKHGDWPNRLWGRPDGHDYRGALEPLEAIMANGQFGDLDVQMIRLNIDRLRAARAA